MIVMKLLHYGLQIFILSLNYCSVAQDKVNIISRYHVPRVWNGRRANLGQFPYQVGITRLIKPYHKGVYGSFCGGAIIGESRVLTAAHCVVPDDERTFFDKLACKSKPVATQQELDEIRIVAGTVRTYQYTIPKRNITYQWRTIKSYNYPRKYAFPDKDVCVITTNEAWEFNDEVSSLPYASKHKDYGDITCRASGYGILNKNPNNPVYSEYLMWEEFDLMTQAKCDRIHETDMKDFICTENAIRDVTAGDSGGALVCKGTGDPREGDRGIIVGVVCGDSEDGNFYTRVSTYTKLIDSAHKIACPQFCIFIGLTVFLLNP